MNLSNILGFLGILVSLILYCLGTNIPWRRRFIISSAILVLSLISILLPRLLSDSADSPLSRIPNITITVGDGNTINNQPSTVISASPNTAAVSNTPSPKPTPTTVKIAVRDQSWDYDGTAHKLDQSAYTVQGLKSGDTLNVKLSIVDSYGNTLSSVTNAGSYSIRADVSGYDPERYVVSATNIGTLNVSRRELTITAQSASKTYDGNALANKYYTAKGLLNGHSIPVDGVQFSIVDSSGSSLSEWPSAVGVYTKKIASVHIVDSNGADVTNNYDISFVDGTITIHSSTTSTALPTHSPTTSPVKESEYTTLSLTAYYGTPSKNNRVQFSSASASSVFPPQGNYSYEPSNVIRDDTSLPWVENDIKNKRPRGRRNWRTHYAVFFK